jgi:hypothetical protein
MKRASPNSSLVRFIASVTPSAVNGEEVTWMQDGLIGQTLPLFGEAENGGSGREPSIVPSARKRTGGLCPQLEKRSEVSNLFASSRKLAFRRQYSSPFALRASEGAVYVEADCPSDWRRARRHRGEFSGLKDSTEKRIWIP